MSQIRGRAWCFGDDVGVEKIMAARYTQLVAEEEMIKHVMEGADPDFASRVRPGDLVVAGQNFGHGASREQAAFSLQRVGVGGVIALSFGRIFFRNCINLGFPALQCAEAGQIRTGDELEFDLETGSITNLTQGTRYQSVPFKGYILAMMRAGGLLPYLHERIRLGQLVPAPLPPEL